MGRTSGWDAATREEPAEGLYFIAALGDHGRGPAGLQHPRVTLRHRRSLSVLLSFLQLRNIPEDSTLSEHQPLLRDIAPSQRGTCVTARDRTQDQALGVKPTQCPLSPPILPRDIGTIIPTGLAQSPPTVAEQKARLTHLWKPTRPPNRSQHHMVAIDSGPFIPAIHLTQPFENTSWCKRQATGESLGAKRPLLSLPRICLYHGLPLHLGQPASFVSLLFHPQI